MLNNLQGQTNPRQLWGTWELEKIEITKQGVTETHSLENLLADLRNLPRDMFTRLYFIDNQIEIKTTEEMFLPEEHLNQKGSFTTEGDKLFINLLREEPRIYSYFIADDLLKIEYAQKETHYYLTYKLFKTIE